MKKVLIVAVAALFAGSAAQAQDIYKQIGGENNIEVLFAPLGGSPIGINGIKYRKFTSATTALRADVFLGYQSSTDIRQEQNSEGDIEDLKMRDNQLDVTISAGIENHFPGTDRLSPYVGVIGLVGFGRTGTSDDVFFNADDDIEQLKTSVGSFTIGANAVCGVDFYFADKMYIGAEVGFGAQFTSEFDSKADRIDLDSSGDPIIVTDEVPNGSSFAIGPNVVGQIRVGFLF